MYATWYNPLTWYLPPDPKDNPSLGTGTVGGGANSATDKAWPWWLDLFLIMGAAVVLSVAVKTAIDKKL